MQLTLWTYEGPPHVGAMRVATSMRDVHYVLHAPQGDTYADLLFTMIERQDKRPPVSYTTFQARDLGTGSLVEAGVDAVRIVTQACPPVAGDLDGNGSIGGGDLAILLGSWGGTGPADLDGNGTVDAGDLSILLGLWNV
jgi:hypothetical protein